MGEKKTDFSTPHETLGVRPYFSCTSSFELELCQSAVFFCFDVRKIYAFDSDRKRLTVMQTLMKKAGVECVTMTNCSFLEVSNPVFIEHLNCKASGTRKETS